MFGDNFGGLNSGRLNFNISLIIIYVAPPLTFVRHNFDLIKFNLNLKTIFTEIPV